MSNWPIIILVGIAITLGFATEGVILYGNSQEATIKAETAAVSAQRQKAEAVIAQQKARNRRAGRR